MSKPSAPSKTRLTTKIPGATIARRGVETSVNWGTVKGGGGVNVGIREGVG